MPAMAFEPREAGMLAKICMSAERASAWPKGTSRCLHRAEAAHPGTMAETARWARPVSRVCRGRPDCSLLAEL
jgi:hypothetical protein